MAAQYQANCEKRRQPAAHLPKVKVFNLIMSLVSFMRNLLLLNYSLVVVCLQQQDCFGLMMSDLLLILVLSLSATAK